MNNEVEVTAEELETYGEEMQEKIEEVIVEEELGEESEEAPPARQGHHPKWYHKQRAHVPGPRRKRKFGPKPVPQEAEEETVAEAPAEAEVSDEGDAFE